MKRIYALLTARTDLVKNILAIRIVKFEPSQLDTFHRSRFVPAEALTFRHSTLSLLSDESSRPLLHATRSFVDVLSRSAAAPPV